MKPQYIDYQLTFTEEDLRKHKIIFNIFKKAYFFVLPKIKEIYLHFLVREMSQEDENYLVENAEDLSILLVSLWLELCDQINNVLGDNKLNGNWSFLNSQIKEDYLKIIESRFNFNELGVIEIISFLNKKEFVI